MFRSLKNLDTAFRHVRLFSLMLIGIFALLCCYTVYKAFRYATQIQQTIYVISNGKAVQAFSASRKDNIGVEARSHIQTFHFLFFTLVPDEKQIRSTMQKALYLADGSAKAQYDNLQEQGYYRQVVSANINQDVVADSIIVQADQHPYYFRFYGKQRIVRPTSVVTRSLVTEGYLRDLNQRTDDNPHGFLIEKWATVENNDLQIEKR